MNIETCNVHDGNSQQIRYGENLPQHEKGITHTQLASYSTAKSRRFASRIKNKQRCCLNLGTDILDRAMSEETQIEDIRVRKEELSLKSTQCISRKYQR